MSGYHERDWEPFPTRKLRRVGRQTTAINEEKVRIPILIYQDYPPTKRVSSKKR